MSQKRGVGVHGQANPMSYGSPAEKVGSAGTTGKGIGQVREVSGSTPGGSSAKVGMSNQNQLWQGKQYKPIGRNTAETIPFYPN